MRFREKIRARRCAHRCVLLAARGCGRAVRAARPGTERRPRHFSGFWVPSILELPGKSFVDVWDSGMAPHGHLLTRIRQRAKVFSLRSTAHRNHLSQHSHSGIIHSQRQPKPALFSSLGSHPSALGAVAWSPTEASTELKPSVRLQAQMGNAHSTAQHTAVRSFLNSSAFFPSPVRTFNPQTPSSVLQVVQQTSLVSDLSVQNFSAALQLTNTALFLHGAQLGAKSIPRGIL